MLTGGAIGIGEADSILFAQEGAKVVIGDINEREGQKVVAEIKGQGFEASFVKLYIAKEKDWLKAFRFIKKRYGKVNIVVNNAGVSLGKDIEATTLDEWNWLMNINSTGVFLGTKYAIINMKDNGENCSIVNRSLIDGQVGEAGLAAYCASKGSVRILMNLRNEDKIVSSHMRISIVEFEIIRCLDMYRIPAFTGIL